MIGVMEIRQLRHLVALAEEGSFTRAAAREHIVQSGLSTSIRALEKAAGTELYVRGSRPVRLTRAGSALLGSARRALAEIDRGQQLVREVTGRIEGPFSVGLVDVGSLDSSCPFVGWLSGFVAAHPGLEIAATQPTTDDAIRQVREQELDCALVASGLPVPDGLQSLPLSSEPLVLICHPGHRLARQATASPDDLAGERFVDTVLGRESRDMIDAAFTDRGLYRHVACEVADLTMVVELVAAGLGVALVPASSSPDPRLVAVQLADLELTSTLQLLLPPPTALTPTARAFAEHVRHHLAAAHPDRAPRRPRQRARTMPVPAGGLAPVGVSE